MRKMDKDEAIEICNGWFAYLESQKEKARRLQEAATLARKGKQDEARKIVNEVDRQPRVYDGARLEPAVRRLIELVNEHD